MSTYSDISELAELDVLEYPEGTEYQLVDRYAREALPNKQNTLTAGSRINITGDVISAETEINDTQTTSTNTWSAEKLSDQYVTQEQVNNLLQSQATQVQQVLNIGGSNLIPYPYKETTKTQNGLTFTDNGDRTITVNGVATADTTFLLCGDTILPTTTEFATHQDINYKISGCPEGGDYYEGYCLMYQRQGVSGAWGGMWETGEGHTFTNNGTIFTQSDVPTSIYIHIQEGTTCDSIVFNPSLISLNDESNVNIQGKLTAGPGITIDSNDVISAKIDSNTIKFNSNSEIALASEITSEINSLSLQGSQHTSQLTSMSTSMSELASTASSLSTENSVQTSEIASLSTAESELASELDGKQDSLTAGTNITIANNVISASSGGGGSDVQLIDTFDGNIINALNEFYSYLSQMTEDQLRRCYITVTSGSFMMVFRFTSRPTGGTSYVFSCYQPSPSNANAFQIIKMISTSNDSTYGIWTVTSGASSLAAAISYAANTSATGTYKLYA